MRSATGSILRWSYRFLRNFHYTSISRNNNSAAIKNELGKLPDRRLYLRVKCGPCGNSIEKWLSKQAYDHGVIIVTCDHCKNRHLIADNLRWFPDVDRARLPKLQAARLEASTSVESDKAAVDISIKGTDRS
ncbi:DNL-type zinc finger protein-like [Varroa jacobsoni]|uniref:DNL-type domain-containing protein n=1 Tax=Varroa destructor TaxID=109461 RepID=A0A7M7KVN9_VARDE|nr:DNL-type zinc finger protein-like [Varroa destructor]XP_022700226.1 DNL-type zinc finger protein-like [Varroa jacobsoni]